MANYKELITGTFNKVVGKVKEVADNTNVRELCEQGTDKVKAYGRIAKLNIEIAGHNDALKRLYTEIGKQYYEQAKENPEGFFAALFAQVDDLKEEVAEKEAEIAALKEGCLEDPDIAVEVIDFEEVVDGTCCCTCVCEEDTCTCSCNGETCTCECDENGSCTCTCGGETCTCTCESVCDKVENVIECVCDKVEEVCDKIEDKIECCCDKIEEKLED